MCCLVFSLSSTVFKSKNTFKTLYYITIHLYYIVINTLADVWAMTLR